MTIVINKEEKMEDKMILVVVTIVLLVITVIGTMRVVKSKIENSYNPIKKDNSDYRFIEVENIKTRNIF